jgi:gliding motility-associated-like protein
LALNPATGEINLAASPLGTYTITSTIVSSGTCPTATSTWSITISNPPSATIAYSAPSYCSNDTTLQNVAITGSTGGFFSISPTGLSINPTTGAFTPSTSTPGIYTVTYTKPAAGGCPQYGTTTTVEIKTLPIATFNYGAAPYCQNAGTVTPTYTGGGTGGVFTSTPGLSIDPSTGAIDLGLSSPGSYTVTNTIGAIGGCPSVVSTANITITNLPIGTFNYANSPYCQTVGTVTPIFTGGGMAGTFSSTSGLVINPTTGEVDLAASATGIYTVTNTIPAANGCTAVVETAQITINPIPVATLASSDADNTICSNDTATISVVPTNFIITDATYVWTLNGTAIPSATTSQVAVTTTGTYEVTINLNGCTTVVSQVFTVNALPNFTLSPTNLVKCGGEHAVISVVPVNFSLTDPSFTYAWTHDGTPMSNTTSSIDVTDFGVYEVTVTNQGCSSTHNVTVIPDNTDIPIGTVGECSGTNYIITASPISGSYDPNSVSYQWYNNNDLSTVIGTQSTFNVTQYVNANNISTASFPLHFTVKITTIPEGCIGDEIFDVISSACTIQKGISPNGDGANDFFDLRGLGVKQLNIYNRYGTKVYSFANYTDEWKGQSDKGQILPDGTYYFVIEQTSGETKSGWVYINR